MITMRLDFGNFDAPENGRELFDFVIWVNLFAPESGLIPPRR